MVYSEKFTQKEREQLDNLRNNEENIRKDNLPNSTLVKNES